MGSEAEAALVAGRYELGGLVASGAMGSVYRARDTETASTVALKILDYDSSESLKRFSREVRAMKFVDHPGVVGYLDHGDTDSGAPFLVMDWVEGQTLEARLDRGVLSIAEARTIARQLASALAAIHERGIVHRDLKPSNIMLEAGEATRVKLLDFGVAHLAIQSLGMTRTGTIIGTPEFMSPEQARGDKTIGPTADVFAFGAVLYECLTGVSPFGANQVVATLAKVLFSQPPAMASLRTGVPRGLVELVTEMIAKESDDRPADGSAVLARLDAIVDDEAHTPIEGHVDTLRPGLGSEEHAVLTVVLGTDLVEAPGESGVETRNELPTVIDSRPLLSELAVRTEGLGVTLHAPAQGGVIATIDHGHAPVDRIRAACRCALRVRESAPHLSIVIATGRGKLGAEFPVGRVIDLASNQLAAGVAAGTIRIDETTAGLLDSRFVIGGDEGGLLLVEELPRGDSVRRFMGRETPLVGRRRELRMLEMTYGQCVEESTARAILVTSPAGGGKSRLRYELLRRLATVQNAPTILMAWGDAIRMDSPLSAISSAIRREAGILEGDRPGLMRARLRARVGRSMSDEGRDRHLPFLGELATVAFDDDELPALRAARRDQRLMADRMRQAFEAWIGAECAMRPVVLVLDDLHWADAASVELVGNLLREASAARLFVLALSRPTVEERFGELWAKRGVDRIALRDLPKKAARRLIVEVLGDDADEDMITRIIDLAGGNAFFLEELIRTVAEGEGAGLPESIASMVQARLSAFSAEARRVLRAASVFGEVCWRSGITSLLGERTDEAVDEHLDVLVEAEVLTPRMPSRFGEDTELVFRHALVRETAYEMLGDEDRTLGHRLAGEWLELAGEHDALTLAEHFERGGAPDRAAQHLAKAAHHALAAHDVESASRRVQRGLSLTGKEEVGAVLHAIGAEVERWRGRHREAREHALEALETLDRGTAEWVGAASEAIAACARLGDYDRAELIALGVEQVRSADRSVLSHQVSALCLAARQLFHAGRYSSAKLRMSAAARFSLEGHLDPAAEAELHRVRAARARQFGDPQGDADGYGAALACYERAGDARRACNTRISLGFALAELGELGSAETQLRRALENARRMGLDPIEARAWHNLGMVLCEQGRLDEADEVEQRALALSLVSEDRRLEGGSRVYLSAIALAKGENERAELEASAAAEAFVGMRPARAGALASLARARVAAGRACDAHEPSIEAMDALRELGGIEEYESLVYVARAEALIANDQEAREVLELGGARLRERAAFVSTPEGRERFIDGDSVNARLAALCAEHGVEVRE